MSARKILRIVLAVVLLFLLWQRFPSITGARRIALISILIVLLAAILVLTLRKPRNLKDDVPKRPLGLDS
jgi:hypothetical protein